jgi:glycerophosphoryl diester phosphodiesterase
MPILTVTAALGATGGPVRPPPPFAGVAGPLIIAHRGGSLEAPENTVAAFAHAVACGADWQELDVTLTKDEQAVVIHDDTLDRTTTGRGRVDTHTLAELRQLTAGRPRPSDTVRAALDLFHVTPPDFGARYATQRVPTLDEALAVPDTRLMIELKKVAHPRRLAEVVVAAIRRADAAPRVAVASFDSDLLELVHDREPAVPLIGLVEEEQAIEGKLLLPIQVLAARLDLVAAARAAVPPAVAVWGWTAYTPEMAEMAVQSGAHGVITDAPSAVVKAFRTPPPNTREPSH